MLLVVSSVQHCHLDTNLVPMEQDPRDQPFRRALHPSGPRQRWLLRQLLEMPHLALDRDQPLQGSADCLVLGVSVFLGRVVDPFVELELV